MAEKLKAEDIDVIYTSPLARCRDTALIIQAAMPSVPLVEDELLVERDFGIFTGLAHAEVDWAKIDTDIEEDLADGVEPLSAMRERMLAFLKKVEAEHGQDRVCIVTHSNPIRTLYSEFLGINYHETRERYKIGNGSLSIFEIDGGEIKSELLDG